MVANALVFRPQFGEGIQRADINPSEPIGIIGIGGLESLRVQFAKDLRHPVVSIDDREEGMALVQEFPLKADLVVNFNDSESAEKIKSWAGKGASRPSVR